MLIGDAVYRYRLDWFSLPGKKTIKPQQPQLLAFLLFQQDLSRM